jgi:malic enzyme
MCPRSLMSTLTLTQSPPPRTHIPLSLSRAADNDDIQGTAAVTVAGILGAIKLKNPGCTDLIGALRKETFLFHGAGSANLGAINLLAKEVMSRCRFRLGIGVY